jgi:hypothetical protein
MRAVYLGNYFVAGCIAFSYQFRLRRNDILKEHQECNEDNLCLNA